MGNWYSINLPLSGLFFLNLLLQLDWRLVWLPKLPSSCLSSLVVAEVQAQLVIMVSSKKFRNWRLIQSFLGLSPSALLFFSFLFPHLIRIWFCNAFLYNCSSSGFFHSLAPQSQLQRQERAFQHCSNKVLFGWSGPLAAWWELARRGFRARSLGGWSNSYNVGISATTQIASIKLI